MIRLPQFAGFFYPEENGVLKEMINSFLEKASIEKLNKKPKAIIVPHAGYIYSGPIAAYSYKAISNFKYKKIILLGPSHNFYFKGFASSPFLKWLTPLGELNSLTLNDFPLISKNNLIFDSEEIHLKEHSLEVQLPFLQIIYNKDNYFIFPLLTGEIDFNEGKEVIGSLLNNETLLIVSSDLSHYLPFKEAQKQDKVTADAIFDLDLDRFMIYGDACGKIPLSILISLAKEKNWQPNLLKLSNSGETAGGKDRVVGYLSMVFI